MSTVVGWDIGGVNTKAARVRAGVVEAVATLPFEIEHRGHELVEILRSLFGRLGAPDAARHAVTMTAELSQRFRSKREGVSFVLDAVDAAFPRAAVLVYAVDGQLLAPEDARRAPLRVAASNWAATARVVARAHPDAVLIDVGTTTTDIVPIVNGEVVAAGLTDCDRLRESELLYLGVLRTPVEAIVHEVPFRGGWAGVSAERFALAGDVYLWRGDLAPDDYTVLTPDRRGTTREFVRERLARVVCADPEQVSDDELSSIVEHVSDAMISRIAGCIARVLDGHPRIPMAVTTGLGEALATRAARRLGLRVTSLAMHLGEPAARLAPAAAVALLLADLAPKHRDR